MVSQGHQTSSPFFLLHGFPEAFNFGSQSFMQIKARESASFWQIPGNMERVCVPGYHRQLGIGVVGWYKGARFSVNKGCVRRLQNVFIFLQEASRWCPPLQALLTP